MASPAVTRTAALLAAVLLAGLAGFQLALVLGAPWGRAAYGGATAQLPAHLRVTSAVAIVVWTLVALIVLRRAGIGVWAPLPAGALPAAVWAIAALLVVAVVLNAVTPSAIERAIWLPVSLLLLGSTLAVAITARGR